MKTFIQENLKGLAFIALTLFCFPAFKAFAEADYSGLGLPTMFVSVLLLYALLFLGFLYIAVRVIKLAWR